jgi:hypothetical protein
MITFSSDLSRFLLLKESTQSLKHLSTNELYIRKLNVKPNESLNGMGHTIRGACKFPRRNLSGQDH